MNAVLHLKATSDEIRPTLRIAVRPQVMIDFAVYRNTKLYSNCNRYFSQSTRYTSFAFLPEFNRSSSLSWTLGGDKFETSFGFAFVCFFSRFCFDRVLACITGFPSCFNT